MVGAFGLFGTLFLLFCRYLPMIAIAEVKAVMPEANPHAGHAGDDHGIPSGAVPALREPRSSEDSL
jgi:molybdopterin-containing oxidoreductase family membrane subunit